MKLEKQNVLITGSANRIGKEIAKHLSKLGLNIAIHYNSSKKEAENTLSEIKKENVNADIFQSNLSNEENCKNLIIEAEKKLGKISILINNASTFKQNTLENTTSKTLQEDLFINLVAPFILAQSFLIMKKKEKL
ncbi:MAG: hypothetical protein Ct9H90mP2_03650 [Dehalococcoidia bacterium]|nr:MAG: hypothetical protein Ct9H90mP2_03650 [Dehalococcoidia bacterium]